TVAITVNAAAGNMPPSVSAGPSQNITIGTGGSPSPGSANFNFSNSAVSISGWANMHGSPGSGVVTATMNGITLSSVATANWAALNGTTSYDGNGMSNTGYFGNSTVSANNWYQYGDPSANYNASKPQLQASGLVPGTSYTVKVS